MISELTSRHPDSAVYKTSAKASTGVTEAFEGLAKSVIQKMIDAVSEKKAEKERAPVRIMLFYLYIYILIVRSILYSFHHSCLHDLSLPA